MCVYVCLYVNIYECVCMYVCRPTCVCVCKYVCMCVCVVNIFVNQPTNRSIFVTTHSVHFIYGYVTQGMWMRITYIT